jgi:uncharacterized protein (TIGR02246 family)
MEFRQVFATAAASVLAMSIGCVALASETDRPLVDVSERLTPAQLLLTLNKYIATRDLDGVLALHDEDAGLVEFGGQVSRGLDELRVSYAAFFATEPDLKVMPLQIIEADGMAVILGSYTLDYTNANGKVVSVSGKFGDMVRQQADGSWLYLLDNPYAP